DLKAVCIACQTFALSALKYLKQGERFPSFFNINLKLGNALISPVKLADRQMLADKFGEQIKEMIQWRRKAVTLENTAKAYEQLVSLLQKIEEIKRPIMQELVQENVAPILLEFWEELKPFCWELEFPEVFFEDDGKLKETGGFDVMIGNSPWEALRPRDKEFFDAIEPGFRFESKEERDRKKAFLLRNRAIDARYEKYCDQVEAYRRFVIDSGLYHLQFPTVYGEVQTSDVNMFKCLLERALDLTKPRDARFSIILQSGVSRDLGSRDLRLESIRTGKIVGLWEFRNKTK